LRVFLLLLLILLLAGGSAAGYLWYALEKPYGTIPSAGVFVEIPHGSSHSRFTRDGIRGGPWSRGNTSSIMR
jgi:hypothetical protein